MATAVCDNLPILTLGNVMLVTNRASRGTAGQGRAGSPCNQLGATRQPIELASRQDAYTPAS